MCLLPVSELCFSKPCLPEEKGTSSRTSHWERVCALGSSQSHSGEGTRKNTVGCSLPRGEDNPRHLKEGKDSAVGTWDSRCPQITWGKHLLCLRHLVTQQGSHPLAKEVSPVVILLHVETSSSTRQMEKWTEMSLSQEELWGSGVGSTHRLHRTSSWKMREPCI